jgi:hypothetical protein
VKIVETSSVKELLHELFVRAVRNAKAALGEQWAETPDQSRFDATMAAFGALMDDNMQSVIDEFVSGVTILTQVDRVDPPPVREVKNVLVEDATPDAEKH